MEVVIGIAFAIAILLVSAHTHAEAHNEKVFVQIYLGPTTMALYRRHKAI